MCFVIPKKIPKDLHKPLTDEELKIARKAQLDLFSSMHPIPNSWVEWWVKRKIEREQK